MQHSKVNILLVDDKPDKLLALEAVLEDLNQNIVRAYSGRDALRAVLQQEFAVILLDVNMPGMDGFETASLIRKRRSTEHVPIIFITAFNDDMHAARGYSLGAVDFITAPVVSEVLRTKVSVFVDLFIMTEQVRRQADALRRRAGQLQKLAAASVAIHSAPSIEGLLRVTGEIARDVIGAHQAIALFFPDPIGGRARPPQAIASFSDRHATWRDRRLKFDALASLLSGSGAAALRLGDRDLRCDPRLEALRDAMPPMGGGLVAAPLPRHQGGAAKGLLCVADRDDAEFTADDEAILVQLAQMASTAIENTLFAEERETNRVKDEFLATLSHELRTPLNAILGWTQLLRMEPLGVDARHSVDVIERNAKAQTKLIEDLLDVSRITTAKLRLHVKPGSLTEIINAAMDVVRPAADAKQIILEARVDPATDSITADADRLQQVIWNLLSNAVKFTPSRGHVRLWTALGGDGGELGDSGPADAMRDAAAADAAEAAPRNGAASAAGGVDAPAAAPLSGASVEICVQDDGPGIKAQFLPFVFDRFRQADSTSTRTHGGLGIGLTVVRHVVELHGGEVRAQSEGEGCGALFVVRLPRIAWSDAPAAAAGASLRARPAPTVVLDPLAGATILVVDDDADAREMVARILSRAGASVLTAPGTLEALRIIAEARPRLVISDIAMPGQDGYDMVRQLRQLRADQGGQTPAIALTAYAREEDRLLALASGFQAHIAKPIEPDDIIGAACRLLTDRAQPREPLLSEEV